MASLALAAACGGERGNEGVRGARAAATGPLAAGSGPARMVADIRTSALAESSSPSGFVSSADRLWFVADDGAAGREVWSTDGTEVGTVLVADLLPGLGSSAPSSLTAFLGGVLFAASDGARGSELWRADATGASLVKDLEPGSRSSAPHGFAEAGGVAYFAAETAAQGVELWRTDGTEAGTSLVADVLPGPAGSDPSSIALLGTTPYFAADGGAGVGVVLWRIAGGVPETVRSNVGARISSPSRLTAAGGRLYFRAPTAPGDPEVLWSTDGTQAGTRPVGTVAPDPNNRIADPSLLTSFGGQLFYRARRGAIWNLYSTDGQTQTQRTGGALGPDLDPAELLATAGRLYVSGATAATGRELFAFDGLVVSLLLDIEPGTASSSPAHLVEVNGTLLFGAGTLGVVRLWKSDGTAAGTAPVGGPVALAVGEIAALGARAILAGDGGGVGVEPWGVDVGPAGAVTVPAAPLRNLHPDLPSSHPRDLTASLGRLFFSADVGPDLAGVPVDRELWSTDGTAAGTALAWDVWFLANGDVGGLADGGDVAPCAAPEPCGGLLFTAFDEVGGRELWRFDGVEAQVRDLRPGGASSAPSELTRVGNAVLFAANDGATGVELWSTDGTAAGTAQVIDLRVGVASSSPRGLTAANGLLFFAATENGFDFAPFASDGTSGGTRGIDGVDGLFDPVVAPAGFSALGPDVLFSATTGLLDDRGRELFRYSPATGRTTLVKDVAPGATSSDPTPVVASGAIGYFGASDGAGVGLWRTDGTDAGTSLVHRLGALGGGAVGSAVVVEVGGAPRLFLVGDDEQHGPELWTSDGTTGGTALVRDVFPGPIGSAAGSVLFPLPSRGHVLYAASDGAAGRELWISNGTPLGTRLLQDLRPGPESSNPRDFVPMAGAGGEALVFFTADDGAAGRELWVLDVSPGALDLTPPVPECVPVTREAQGPDGARPQFAVAATDDVSPPAAITFTYEPAPGSLFPLGATPVLATAADESGNLAQCTFDLAVVDTTGPVMTCPDPAPFEATSAAGAIADYPPVSAVDVVSGAATVVYSKAAGTLFPLGGTPVSATGTDALGNTASCTFTVSVLDTTAPVLACPADVTANATGLGGAAVTYPEPATATDAVSAPAEIALAYDPPSGSTFPLGTTPVTVSGTDAAGNVGSCTFDVIVVDATPPVITCPAPPPVEATSPAGAPADWAPATATDLETASPAITYDHVAGSTFPLGTTIVTATATDLGGNQASCTFPVVVRDTTAPSVTCVGLDTVAEATGPQGAAVEFPPAQASDVATAQVALTYDAAVSGQRVPAPPGSTFPLGRTVVIATATDGAGLTAFCTFAVTVQDTTAPAPSCPAPLVVEAADATGAVATFSATASDAVDPAPVVLAAPPSGSTFGLGTTEVTVTAQDAALNSAVCTFPVTVQDTTPPVVTCPTPAAVEATGPGGAAVTFDAATAADAVTPGLLVSYTVEPGSTFPVGATTVTASASDAAGNAGSCAFAVTVRDTTPPALTCPADVAVEAPGPTPVELPAASASDAVTPSPVVTTSVPSGSVFEAGTTVVTYTATDAAGNAASCTVEVTVTIRDEGGGGGGCGCGSGGGGSLTLGAVLVALLRRRMRRAAAAR